MLYDYRTNSPLKHIVSNGENVYIIVGAGTVMRSEDNGESWEHLLHFGGFFTDNVVFFDDKNCVIVGQKMLSQSFAAFYSTDKGITWTEAQYSGSIIGSSSADLSSLELLYTSTGECIVGTGAGSIIRSGDYGKSWQKVAMFDGAYRLTNTLTRQNANTLHSFRETEYNRSVDNGKTWSGMTKIPTDGNVVAALCNNNIISVAVNYTVEQKITFLESSDNGENWTVSSIATSLENVVDVSFLDSQTIVAFRSNTKPGFYLTTDKGKTWNSYLDIQTPVQLYDVHFTNNNRAFVIGDRKSIFSVNTADKTFQTKSLIKLQSSNSSITILRKMPDSSIVFCDLGNSSPVTSTDFGSTWTQNEQIFGNTIVTDVYFRTSKNGYAIMPQQDGLFFETSNSGKTWEFVNTKNGKSYKAPTIKGPSFSFVNEKKGIVVVKDENNTTGILSTNDGGETWQENIDTNYTHYYAKLQRYGNTDIVYAVSTVNENKSSFTQEILVSTDIGKSWKRNPITDNLAIEDFHVFDALNILVIGRSGKNDSANHRRFFRTTDGGVTWLHILKDNVASFPRTIAIEQNVCIVGCHEYDSVLVSTDYGFTWKAHNIRPIQTISQLKYSLTNSFIYKNDYYATGYLQASFTPVPTSSPFVAKIPLPSNLTGIEHVENSDPFARVWIFDVVPNPITRRARISLFCDPSVKQSLSVGLFNVQGIQVKDLTSDTEITPTGHGSLNFEADGISSGMYLLKISGGGTTRTQLIAIIQ